MYKKIIGLTISSLSKLYNTMKYEVLPYRKITVIQMPIIDVCNSHCFMCNIWKNKENYRATPIDYEKILSDPLFKDVAAVGLNGGEPTMRKDLLEIARVLVAKLKKLKSVNIITNGIQGEDSFEVLSALNEYFKKNGIKFDISISLDGDDVTHDFNRGVGGNYLAATSLIKKLKNGGLDVWIGGTITKRNLFSADDIAIFAKENKLDYFEIRMGVDIKRLHNDGFFNKEEFTEDEKFHIVQFFQGMYYQTKNYFYYSLFRQLAHGEKRTAGCYWRNGGVTLDSQGQLSFCSVKSPIIGNCLKEDASEIFKKNISVRESIKQRSCGECMHDLIGPMSAKNLLKFFRSGFGRLIKIFKLHFDIKCLNLLPAPVHKNKTDTAKLQNAKTVIITGWWGTETQGDKAILGELIDFINKKSPKLEKFYLTVYEDMEYVVEKTIKELGETGVVDVSRYAGTIPIANFHQSDEFKKANFIFVGGGPLERIMELVYIEKAFRHARKRGKGTFIFGCGIDPILLEYKKIIASIIANSDKMFFRDKQSAVYATSLVKNLPFPYYACDPAFNFVKKWRDKRAPLKDRNGLATLIRANTGEYLVGDSENKINSQNENHARDLATFLSGVDMPINFLSMNNIWIGSDDRLFNRIIIKNIDNKKLIEKHGHKYMGLNELLENICGSKFVLATRYHAHIFSLALGLPFLSIDYTGKGNKIENLLKNADYPASLSVSWNELNTQGLRGSFDELVTNYNNVEKSCNDISSRLTSNLEKIYEKFE
jgi:MoaA/NifB/PqqE/SkfB family radical SAM enzyme/polysaccharide pyruvyl transferase WcaK-like protein